MRATAFVLAILSLQVQVAFCAEVQFGAIHDDTLIAFRDGRWQRLSTDDSAATKVFASNLDPMPTIDIERATQRRWRVAGDVLWYIDREGIGVRGATPAGLHVAALKAGKMVLQPNADTLQKEAEKLPGIPPKLDRPDEFKEACDYTLRPSLRWGLSSLNALGWRWDETEDGMRDREMIRRGLKPRGIPVFSELPPFDLQLASPYCVRLVMNVGGRLMIWRADLTVHEPRERGDNRPGLIVPMQLHWKLETVVPNTIEGPFYSVLVGKQFYVITESGQIHLLRRHLNLNRLEEDWDFIELTLPEKIIGLVEDSDSDRAYAFTNSNAFELPRGAAAPSTADELMAQSEVPEAMQRFQALME